mmetsp:Transcript_22924/g.78030  ORF Transcript_22924/g.78030 Transcript_22924/m.78030 type:complete len:221 (-) Transcript_22924:536-1198(-)
MPLVWSNLNIPAASVLSWYGTGTAERLERYTTRLTEEPAVTLPKFMDEALSVQWGVSAAPRHARLATFPPGVLACSVSELNIPAAAGVYVTRTSAKVLGATTPRVGAAANTPSRTLSSHARSYVAGTSELFTSRRMRSACWPHSTSPKSSVCSVNRRCGYLPMPLTLSGNTVSASVTHAAFATNMDASSGAKVAVTVADSPGASLPEEGESSNGAPIFQL